MDFALFIKENRRRIELEIMTTDERQYFSPIYLAQYQITIPLFKEYLHGHLLDVGCGDMPFKEMIIPLVTEYHGLDMFPRNSDVFYVQDIQDMEQVPSERYDSVICLEVLEHIPDPFRALHELSRVLNPNGICIISVPHLSRIHEEPYDFYRYTKYGLQYMLEAAGFEILQIEVRGGLLTFLGHQISTVILGVTWSVPIIKNIAWFFNKWLITILFNKVDNLINTTKIFPAGYSVVARKIS